MNEQRREPVWSELDDAALLQYLFQSLRHHEHPPRSLVELAKASFGLRHVDAELAALVADSLDEATGPRVRSVRAPRMVSFESRHLAIELEAAPTGSGWRIVGQLEPAGEARIDLLRSVASPAPTVDADRSPVDADRLGRFAVTVTDPGPLSLLCHRPGCPDVATSWILLG